MDGYTGKGVEENLIPTAQEAISTYKTSMSTILGKFKTEISFAKAFIGETQSSAISIYYGALMDAVKETFDYLDSFSTAVADAAEAYRAEAKNIADSVRVAGPGRFQSSDNNDQRINLQ